MLSGMCRGAVAAVALAAVAGGLAVASPARAQGAGDLSGVWLTQSGESKVRLAPCGGAICGVITWTKAGGADVKNPDAAKRSRPLAGLQMIHDMKRGADGVYQGKLYNPQDGKTYTGKLTQSNANTLKLSGCVMGGLICKSQTWTRSQ